MTFESASKALEDMAKNLDEKSGAEFSQLCRKYGVEQG